MDAATLKAKLDRFAASDLRKARAEGEVIVCGTKRGNVAVRYIDGSYSLTVLGLNSVVLASGKPAVVRPFLASLYDVVVES